MSHSTTTYLFASGDLENYSDRLRIVNGKLLECNNSVTVFLFILFLSTNVVSGKCLIKPGKLSIRDLNACPPDYKTKKECAFGSNCILMAI